MAPVPAPVGRPSAADVQPLRRDLAVVGLPGGVDSGDGRGRLLGRPGAGPRPAYGRVASRGRRHAAQEVHRPAARQGGHHRYATQEVRGTGGGAGDGGAIVCF